MLHSWWTFYLLIFSSGSLRPTPEPATHEASSRKKETSDIVHMPSDEAGQGIKVFHKFLAKCCSCSAVSAPIFASKYGGNALCSIFQNLPDYLAEIFEIWQDFADFADFAAFAKFC